MARGWIAGLLTGAVVAGLGLAVVSVVFGPVASVTPPQVPPVATPETAAPATAPSETETVAPDAAPAESAMEEGQAPEATAQADVPDAAAPEDSGTPQQNAPAEGVAPDDRPTDAGDVAGEMPQAEAAPADETPAQAPVSEEDSEAENGDAAQTGDSPAAPGQAVRQEPDEAATASETDKMPAPEPTSPVQEAAAPPPAPVADAERPTAPQPVEPEPDSAVTGESDTGPDGEAVEAEAADATPPAPVPVTPPQAGARLAPAATPQPLPEPEPEPETAPEAEPEEIGAAAPPPLEPKTIIVSPEADLAPELDTEPGVVVNRLPMIGDAPEPAPEAEKPREPALSRNALAFAPSGDQPRLSFLLIDTGAADRESLGDLGKLPFPVTVAIDASAVDAQEAITFYREHGAEVVLEMPLPEGATPTDIDVTVEAYGPLLDQAIAVLPEQTSDFQTLGAAAVQLATNLAETGHGLVSYPAGLNTGHKAAVKEGVKAGLVFRDLDSKGQGGAVIRRFLDNAAFKARGHDGVIVVARTRTETVQALLEWSLGTRAQSVALAPVSAVLAGK